MVHLSPSSTQCRQDGSYLVRFTGKHKETAWPLGIWPVGDRVSLRQGVAAPSNTCIVWSVLWPLNKLFLQAATNNDGSGRGGQLLGWPAQQCCDHACGVSVNRGVRIVMFDPCQSMEFNQRSMPADTSNMQYTSRMRACCIQRSIYKLQKQKCSTKCTRSKNYITTSLTVRQQAIRRVWEWWS